VVSFSAGCTGYMTSCSCCPQLRRDPFSVPSAVLRDKIELLSDARTTLIAPSRWMAVRARESRLFRRAADLIVVPNCVDILVFGRHSAAEARHTLGLSSEATYVLCVVDQGLQTRKGIHLLGQIMQACAQDPRFQAARGRLLWVGPKLQMRPAGTRGSSDCVSVGRRSSTTSCLEACRARAQSDQIRPLVVVQDSSAAGGDLSPAVAPRGRTAACASPPRRLPAHNRLSRRVRPHHQRRFRRSIRPRGRQTECDGRRVTAGPGISLCRPRGCPRCCRQCCSRAATLGHV